MIPKFRAWDKKTKCMSEVKLIDCYSDVAWLEDVVERGMQFTAHRKFDDIILMQSTGLKDKKGVEIFEGDVITYTVFNQLMNGVYEIRRARSGAWRMDNAIQGRELWLANPENVEIIGNIYENPELLEEQ